MRRNRPESGRGRNQGNRQGAGPAGKCICPACGTEVDHQRDTPCYEMKCPDCGTVMRRR